MEKLKTFLKGTVKSLGFSGVALDKIMRVIYLIVFIVALKAAYSLFNSDYEGTFVLYEKDPKTGKTELLKFRAKKENHHPQLSLNMLGVNFDSDMNKTVSYHRRVMGFWGFQFYVGGSYSQDIIGRPSYGISIMLGF